MADTTEEGPHIHQPCTRCGLVEAETGGLCPECATQLADAPPAYDAAGQGPDPQDSGARAAVKVRRLATDGIFLGRERIDVKLVRSRRAIVLRQMFGHKAEISLDELLEPLTLDQLHDMLDPIFQAAQEAQLKSERQLRSAQRRRVRERDRHTCRYCGGKGDQRFGPDRQSWHIDHVVPVVAGGLDEDHNLVLACATCNLAKRAQDLGDFEEEAQERAVAHLRVVGSA